MTEPKNKVQIKNGFNLDKCAMGSIIFILLFICTIAIIIPIIIFLYGDYK